MRKIQQNEAEAIASMANTPEFIKFLGWLDKSKSDAVQGMINGDSDHMRSKSAGGFDVLDTIIEMSKEASQMVDDIRTRSNKTQGLGHTAGNY